jgi:pre-rRNA-processing protein TSR3
MDRSIFVGKARYNDEGYDRKMGPRKVGLIDSPRKLASQIDGPKLYVYVMGQDDPKKCTSAKLARLHFASPIYRVYRLPRSSLVLNPFSTEVLTPMDRDRADRSGVVAIDCSWEKVERVFTRAFPGVNRRLPFLMAANPTSYAQISRLSSLEALAASLFILGFKDKAKQLLSLFKWGPTFYTLNKAPLDEYQKAETRQDINQIELDYFPFCT